MATTQASGVGGALGGLLGKSGAGGIALYAVVQAMVQEAMHPFLELLAQQANSRLPVVPLSPAQVADMVNRHLMPRDDATGEAALSGVNRDRFGRMVQAAGEPPGEDVLARALRLGLIPDDSGDPNTPGFRQGIQQSRVRDMWTDVIKAVARAYPTPNDILQALLEGQVDEATARKEYEKLGGVLEYFQLLYDTRGTSPTPNEAAEMVHRGIIPRDGTGPNVVSYQQAFLEGPWRNKWNDVFFRLSEHIPPPRTIVAQVRNGAMNDADALKYLQFNGLSAELAASYVAEAHHTKTQAERDLAKSDILALYQEKVLSADQATQMLANLGYAATDAQFLLELMDFRRILTSVNTAIGKFHTLYVAHKIDENAVTTGLDELGVVATQRTELLATWKLERQANVRILTPAEIRKAMNNELMSPDDALAQLENLGYSQADATLYLKL